MPKPKPDITTLNAEELATYAKKLKSRGAQLAMDLHDIAEALPTDWEQIPDISQRTYDCFKELNEAKARLAEIGG